MRIQESEYKRKTIPLLFWLLTPVFSCEAYLIFALKKTVKSIVIIASDNNNFNCCQ
jgi:lipid-A-disaccharide synthase-like uncharacterized protein